MLKFDIVTEPEKYFHQLIEVLRVFAPFDTLRKRERDVFGALLYQLHLIEEKNEPPEKLFDYRVKEEIASSVGISKANLYNIYKELRQHNLLTKNEVNPKYKFKYLQHKEITFKFRGNSIIPEGIPSNATGKAEGN
jgi:predicted transcriptional regulator